MYWYQGWDAAPPMIEHCRESWLAKNPNWSINFLTAENVDQYVSLPQFYSALDEITIAARSDIIRIHLLARHGGVWADATTFCIRPLDEWLDKCTESSGFFAYAKPGPGRPMASWFLAAAKNNAMVEKYQAAVDHVWDQFTNDMFAQQAVKY